MCRHCGQGITDFRNNRSGWGGVGGSCTCFVCLLQSNLSKVTKNIAIVYNTMVIPAHEHHEFSCCHEGISCVPKHLLLGGRSQGPVNVRMLDHVLDHRADVAIVVVEGCTLVPCFHLPRKFDEDVSPIFSQFNQ